MRHHEPGMRASALIALIPGLQDPLQTAQARENALSAVAAIASEEVRAKLLGRLEPLLDVVQLERALTVATRYVRTCSERRPLRPYPYASKGTRSHEPSAARSSRYRTYSASLLPSATRTSGRERWRVPRT